MTNEAPPPIDYAQQRRDLEQLKASKADMAGAISRNIDWLLEMEAGGMLREDSSEPFGIAEASKRARQPLCYEPGIDHHTGKLDPGQVSWFELGNLIEHQPENGRDTWLAIKSAARHELVTGLRSSIALEGSRLDSRPYERAQHLVIIDALVEDLQPRGALEGLMVQRMASVYELCLRWQQLAIQRQEEEVWQGERDKRRAMDDMRPAERGRYQRDNGWLPPRLSREEAIHEAALMSDRYERAFLRLVRAFRDYRRMFASLIVAGGQVNIADGPQQVNVDARQQEKPRGKKRTVKGGQS